MGMLESARWGELLTKGGPAPRKGVFEGGGGGVGLSRRGRLGASPVRRESFPGKAGGGPCLGAW